MAHSYCNDKGAVAFVKKYYPAAIQLGATANVPAEYLLSIAASETGYGRAGSFFQYNNYFSMETASKNPSIPYATGYVTAANTQGSNKPIHVAKFASFTDSGRSFIAKFGPAISGVSSPLEFAIALRNAGFNSGDPRTGGTASFVHDVLGVIDAVKARLACPD